MRGEREETLGVETAGSRRAALALLGIGLAATLAAGGCGGCGDDGGGESTAVPQPSAAQFDAAGLGDLPVAPRSERIDLTAAPFSDPTRVTNPLFPISDLRSTVLNGRIEGKPFHTETTLLPYTRTIEWPSGQRVETLVSQYAAFLDGRIQEVALDYYAQADDGSVWYFGEDVADYDENGRIAFTTDSWLAGVDGPAAMIMPADPTVGEVYRTENVPGLVFEEVSVKTVDKTVDGPAGRVHGAMVGGELHDDGMRSDKVFAPGYGEFFTRDKDGVEAMALAVPTDALEGPPPNELEALSSGADRALAAARAGDWPTVSKAARTMSTAWDRYRRSGEAPPRLEPPMSRAIATLSRAAAAGDRLGAASGAIDVGQAALDLELRYRPPAEIDLARFELWARQALVDLAAGDLGAVNGDVASMEWTRDRFAEDVAATDLTQIDSRLLTLRESVVDGDLGAARAQAAGLRATVAQLTG